MTPIIHNTIVDLVTDLLCYDRKEDEALPVGAIDASVRNGSATIDEIVALFRERLENGLETEGDRP